jgi:ribonuclease Z
MRHVVISHGHIDHVLGLPAWASQRQLHGLEGGVAYVPRSLAEPLAELLALCARLEGGKPYGVAVHGVAAGEVVPLRPDFELCFFATSHWVETLGCRLEHVRRHLRRELADLPGEELHRLRLAGETITEEARTPLVAYLADTGPEVFGAEPWLADAEVLIVECTFLGAGERDRARRFQHLHLDDLAALAPGLRNRHLVLTHLSRRHRLRSGSRAIRAALAGRTTSKVHLLNADWE